MNLTHVRFIVYVFGSVFHGVCDYACESNLMVQIKYSSHTQGY